jgi:hypothetical protein
MAAGLGFKTFNTGEVLTSADVNGYLMQGVLVFASEAARDAAITSPQEGQFAFTKDNNSLWYYDSVAWVASGATGDIEGVTAGTGISGGGTSGTVTITNSMATEIDAKGDLVVGTGADTFARLAVGTNDYVLTADSGETTGLKWAAAAGGGKVLQVVEATYGTDTDTSSTSFSDTGITATITPSAATSKIYCVVTFTAQIRKATAETSGYGFWQLLRGATAIAFGGNGVFEQSNTTSFIDNRNTQSLSKLDAPSTTSATTYKVQYKVGSVNSTLYMLNDNDPGGPAVITLFEIGA